VEACFLDTFPRSAACADFGLDRVAPEITKDNCIQRFAAYKQAVRSGITADQLHQAVGDGPALTKLIGFKIWTVWDVLEDRYKPASDTETSASATETK
jgi:hypothetical protein